jgi:hypothetical protein
MFQEFLQGNLSEALLGGGLQSGVSAEGVGLNFGCLSVRGSDVEVTTILARWPPPSNPHVDKHSVVENLRRSQLLDRPLPAIIDTESTNRSLQLSLQWWSDLGDHH